MKTMPASGYSSWYTFLLYIVVSPYLSMDGYLPLVKSLNSSREELVCISTYIIDYIVTMSSGEKTRIIVIIIKSYISLANLLRTYFEIYSVIYGCFVKLSPRAIRVFGREYRLISRPT